MHFYECVRHPWITFASLLLVAVTGCDDNSSSSSRPSKHTTMSQAPSADGRNAGAGAPSFDLGADAGMLPAITGPAADLAHALTSSASLEDAVVTTQQILAHVGVSVIDPTTGNVISDAGGAVAIWPSHVLNLAEEARFEASRSTITLDQLSDLFA